MSEYPTAVAAAAGKMYRSGRRLLNIFNKLLILLPILPTLPSLVVASLTLTNTHKHTLSNPHSLSLSLSLCMCVSLYVFLPVSNVTLRRLSSLFSCWILNKFSLLLDFE